MPGAGQLNSDGTVASEFAGAGFTRPDALNGHALLRWGRACLDGLQRRRDEINALNVFPIADSDTGTNMLATMRAAIQAAEATVLAAQGGAESDGANVRESRLRASAHGVAGSPGQGGAGSVEQPVAVPVEQLVAAGSAEQVSGLSEQGDSLPAHSVAAAMARGATLGARGNSGIILSQVLRGIAEAVRGGPLTAHTLRDALTRASVLVREGLSVPIEGTILTVLDRAAVGAQACPGSSLAEIAVAAADGAVDALGETPSQLGVLRAAGVVDAGARGLVVLLDSMVLVTVGQAPSRPEYIRGDRDYTEVRTPHAETAVRNNPHFEVMYLLADTDDHRIARLRDRLSDLGDSVVVVGDGADNWSAHVHCADAGAAVEAGIATGTVSDIRIESFVITAPVKTDIRSSAAAHAGGSRAVGRDTDVGRADTDGRDGAERTGAGGCADTAARATAAGHGAVSGRQAEAAMRAVTGGHADPAAPADPAAHDRTTPLDAVASGDAEKLDEPADRGILAVAAGDGAAALFEAAGAAVLAEDGATTVALLAAIRRMPNREVLVLPNGALPAHELMAVSVAARDARRDVLLLPSGSMVQGLAALAVHDRGRIAVDDAFAMSEAAGATRWGSLRAATERALTMVGTCEAEDGLGLVGHDVVVIDRDVRTAGITLLDRMLGFGGELVTLLIGADAPDSLADDLAEHIADNFPGVEVTVYSGGQQADLVQIGVE